MSGKRLYSCNYNYFENIDSNEKAYWLGFLMADGYVSHIERIRHLKTQDSLQERFITGLSTSSNDIEHLYKYKEALNSTHPVKGYKSSGYETDALCCRVLIEDKSLYDSLVKHGMVPHKSLIIKYPEIDSKYDMDFIRGFFDGNGCISSHMSRHGSPEYEFTITSTKEMLETICEKLSLEVSDKRIKQRFPERNVNNYTVKYGGNQQVYSVLYRLYNGADIYLDRKYKKYIELEEYINGRLRRNA